MDTYQKEPNAIYYTSEAMFCTETKKQIYKGFAVKSDGVIKGLYSKNYFLSNLRSIISNHKYIEICMIESNSLPVKDTAKIQRHKMTKKLRYQILSRDGFRCKYCGLTSETTSLHVDHIKPISKGGETVIANLQVLCEACNLGKSNDYTAI